MYGSEMLPTYHLKISWDFCMFWGLLRKTFVFFVCLSCCKIFIFKQPINTFPLPLCLCFTVNSNLQIPLLFQKSQVSIFIFIGKLSKGNFFPKNHSSIGGFFWGFWHGGNTGEVCLRSRMPWLYVRLFPYCLCECYCTNTQGTVS